ncbi:hypothetical protein Efla_007662 [Eimeria flavescens]
MSNPSRTDLVEYSEEEEAEDSWMPFQRSAPDFVKDADKWDLGGFVSPFQCEKIHAIIKAIDLTHEDVVFDLGCGDGRFIIECCRLTSCTGVGVDLDEGLLVKARRHAAAAGGLRADFRQADFLNPELDLRPATVIFVYLLPEALKLLTSRLESLVRGASSLRVIVSLCWPLHAFEASVADHQRRFFLYHIEDLRRRILNAA